MSETDAYLEKFRACDDASKSAEEFIKKFKTLCQMFERWQQLIIVGGKKTVGPFNRQLVEIQLNDLPSVHVLDEILATWHDARQSLEAAWEGLPTKLRVGLKEPPAITRETPP